MAETGEKRTDKAQFLGEIQKFDCIYNKYRKITISPGSYICSKGLFVIFRKILYGILDEGLIFRGVIIGILRNSKEFRDKYKEMNC